MAIFFNEAQVYQWAQTVPAPRADIAIALRVIGRRSPDQRLAEARWGKDAGPGDSWVFDTPCPSLPDETTAEIRADFTERLAEWKRTIGRYRGYRLDLRSTNLQRADLSDLALSGARLDGARMEGAGLRGARMEGADLSEARMEGANLRVARMEGADLSVTRMEGADLSGARMEGADLRRAKFDASTYWGSAVLGGASVQSVDFRNSSITADQLAQTLGDASTKLPDTIPRPAHWPKAKLRLGAFYNELRKWRADPDTYRPPD